MGGKLGFVLQKGSAKNTKEGSEGVSSKGDSSWEEKAAGAPEANSLPNFSFPTSDVTVKRETTPCGNREAEPGKSKKHPTGGRGFKESHDLALSWLHGPHWSRGVAVEALVARLLQLRSPGLNPC